MVSSKSRSTSSSCRSSHRICWVTPRRTVEHDVLEAIALGDQHLQHLAPTGQERVEGLGRIIGQRPRGRAQDRLAESCAHGHAIDIDQSPNPPAPAPTDPRNGQLEQFQTLAD
jgi:hypothetical protein